MSKKAIDAQIIAAYQYHGSVWKAAESLSMCGQSVHERLQKLGVIKPINILTDHEKVKISGLYRRGFIRGDGQLDMLCAELGRAKQFICRYAGTINLTNRNRPMHHLMADMLAENTRKYYALNAHPKGALGMKHSEEAKQKISNASALSASKMSAEEYQNRATKGNLTRIKNQTTAPQSTKINSRGKAGKRDDLNHQFFRSASEANYARLLKFAGIDYLYEQKTFWFDAIKRGCLSYTPDFYLPEFDMHIEFKGWLDAKSITKLKRFKNYYPYDFARLLIVMQKRNPKDYEVLVSKIGIPHSHILYLSDYLPYSQFIDNWE